MEPLCRALPSADGVNLHLWPPAEDKAHAWISSSKNWAGIQTFLGGMLPGLAGVSRAQGGALHSCHIDFWEGVLIGPFQIKGTSGSEKSLMWLGL